ncbi:PAS domain S-box protein [Natrinema versiforme]|uniref:histidine kinase n=1 Tax=Natrinema versiforme JCM 10478 TaxID=1227496 RepID=L9XYM9_9EURY|nr:PAS domain S-box protein [Natrinema versiforme]ELY65708.1 PAS sensor protein [Natrinema versiforme JCM 10478]
MDGTAVRTGTLADAPRRLFAALLVVIGVLLAVGTGTAIPDLATVGVGTVPGPGLFLLGLAARSSSDRTDDIERLTDDLRRFVSRIDGDEPAPFADEPAAVAEPGDGTADDEPVDFTIDRDDEVGQLASVVDELAASVRERERRRAESERSRRQLYRITSDPDLHGETKVRRLLELGCDRLGLETGLVSRIDESTDRYTVETAVGHDADLEGTELDLSEIYCRDTITSDDILGIYDTAATERADHPAAAELGINCYVGGKIVVEGELYGTLCFLSREPRDGPFTPAETSFVDLMARWISHSFERRASVRTIRERERRLERAQEFTDDVLDALDDVFYILDTDGEVQRWNESLAAVTGYADDEIAEMQAVDFFDEADRSRIATAVEIAFETGDTRTEAALRTKSGERIPYEFVAAPLEDPSGETVLAGIGRDISARREKQHRLERTTHLLEQSQQLAAVGAWELDATDTPPDLRWTDEVYRIHGVSPADDIDLERGLEFYHPDDRPQISRAIDRALADGEAYDLELRIRSDDGEIRWVRSIGEPVRADGEVVSLHGAVQDITERKERERELERAEAIIQALDELVYTLDADGNFRFLNDATASVAGYDPEDLLGEHVSTVLADDDLEIARERTRELLRAGEPSRTFEMALETASGDVIETENHMALLPMVDGEFGGTAGVLRDITERKEREYDLERTTELLEQAERLAGIGGWELDVRADSQEVTLTDGLRRLYDLPLDEAVDAELAASFLHPDDRPAVLDTVDAALEDGESYEIEHRMLTTDGTERWVRSIGEPVRADGDDPSPTDGQPAADDEIVGVRGTIQDITERKERELALESLHGAARELLGTDSDREVAELVVATAADILEPSSVAVYGLDSDVNRLEPIAATDEFERLCDGAASVPVGDGDSVLWTAYVTGAGTVVDDSASFDRSRVFGPDVESGIVVPIGDHGVFAVASGGDPIDADARQLIETLVATTEAAFDRLESEASLRERETELEERNRRLNRQIEITELIRRIDQVLIGADGREEIERTIPERLLEADAVSFAWIGALDASGTRLEPRAWAGSGQSYLDDVPLEYDASAEPAVRTARSETPTVVSNAVDGLQGEGWRRQALDRGFQSVISVPLSDAEYTYGVLTVYADEPGAFDDLERTVLTELGEGIANAITAVKTREALHAETLLELTLRLEGSDDLLSRLATATGAHVEYEGLGAHSADETLLFFETSGVPAEDVRAALDDLVSVTSSRLISEANGDCRFEATVAGDVLAAGLVRRGGSPRSMRADGDRLELTVDVPTGTDVREFVDMLREQYATVELLARRHVERSMGTRSELVTSLFDVLTDRQLEVLRTAYFAGFFEWPRESTGEEIAEMLGVTQPTVNRHLRIGQQRLLAQLFDDESAVPAD